MAKPNTSVIEIDCNFEVHLFAQFLSVTLTLSYGKASIGSIPCKQQKDWVASDITMLLLTDAIWHVDFYFQLLQNVFNQPKIKTVIFCDFDSYLRNRFWNITCPPVICWCVLHSTYVAKSRFLHFFRRNKFGLFSKETQPCIW